MGRALSLEPTFEAQTLAGALCVWSQGVCVCVSKMSHGWATASHREQVAMTEAMASKAMRWRMRQPKTSSRSAGRCASTRPCSWLRSRCRRCPYGGKGRRCAATANHKAWTTSPPLTQSKSTHVPSPATVQSRWAAGMRHRRYKCSSRCPRTTQLQTHRHGLEGALSFETMSRKVHPERLCLPEMDFPPYDYET